MRYRSVFVLVCFLALLPGLSGAQSSEKETAAVAAAEKWLSTVDGGNYEQSWREAAEYFKNAVSKDKWVQSLTAGRNPLGKILSRNVSRTSCNTSLPGAPDGEYVVIQFQSSFENKASATETVTPMVEKDGGWRISGYFIQ